MDAVNAVVLLTVDEGENLAGAFQPIRVSVEGASQAQGLLPRQRRGSYGRDLALAGPVLPAWSRSHREVSFSTKATRGVGEVRRKLQLCGAW